jgi:hypothetical protein
MISDGRQKIYTLELIILDPSSFKLGIAIVELKKHVTRYRSSSGRTDSSRDGKFTEICKLITSV